MAELPGKKTKNKLVCKVRWANGCSHCLPKIQHLCQEAGLEVPDFNSKEFFVPYLMVNFQCDQSENIVLKSVYENV